MDRMTENGTAPPARALGAALLALSLAGCGALMGERPALDVTLVNLVPREISPLEQVMEVSLRVRNPNNYPLVLTGARFDLDLNGRPILRGLSNQRVEVPRLGSALMRAEGSASTITLLNQIFELSPDRPIRYKLSGVAFTGGALGAGAMLGDSIPFESLGELNLRPPAGGRPRESGRP